MTAASWPAHALAYDQETGFGLVQALGRLGLPARRARRFRQARRSATPWCSPTAPAGRSRPTSSPSRNSPAIGNICSTRRSSSRRRIRPGAARPDRRRRQAARHRLAAPADERKPARVADINMVVPIDLLPPILDDLLTRGQVDRPPRPWLGAFSAESDGKVVVMSVADGGPAAKAGLRRGRRHLRRPRRAKSTGSPISTARSGRAARPAPRSRYAWCATAARPGCGSNRPTATASCTARICNKGRV